MLLPGARSWSGDVSDIHLLGGVVLLSLGQQRLWKGCRHVQVALYHLITSLAHRFLWSLLLCFIADTTKQSIPYLVPGPNASPGNVPVLSDMAPLTGPFRPFSTKRREKRLAFPWSGRLLLLCHQRGMLLPSSSCLQTS